MIQLGASCLQRPVLRARSGLPVPYPTVPSIRTFHQVFLIWQVLSLCRYHQLPETLTARVVRHFRHKLARTKGVNEVEVLSELPPKLCAKLKLELYHHLVVRMPMLRGQSREISRAMVH